MIKQRVVLRSISGQLRCQEYVLSHRPLDVTRPSWLKPVSEVATETAQICHRESATTLIGGTSCYQTEPQTPTFPPKAGRRTTAPRKLEGPAETLEQGKVVVGCRVLSGSGQDENPAAIVLYPNARCATLKIICAPFQIQHIVVPFDSTISVVEMTTL